MVFLFTSFVTPEAICTDRRSGTAGALSGVAIGPGHLSDAAKFAAIMALYWASMTIGPTLLMLIAFTLEGSGTQRSHRLVYRTRPRTWPRALAMAAFWGALSLARIQSHQLAELLASVAIFVRSAGQLGCGRRWTF